MAAKVVAAGAVAALYAQTAREIGVDDFGSTASVLGAAAFVIALAEGGLNSLALRQLIQDEHSKDAFDALVSVRLVIAAVVLVGWIAVGAAFARNAEAFAMYLLAGLWTALETTNSSLLTMSLASVGKLVSAATVLSRVVALAAGLVLLRLGIRGPAALPGALAIGAAVTFAFLFMTERPRLRRVRVAMVLTAFKRASGFYMTAVLAQAQNLDVLIVSAVAGHHAAGIYGAPSRMTTPLAFATNAYATLLFPRAAADVHRTSRAYVRPIAGFAAVSTAGLALVAATAPALVSRVLGHAYQGSVAPLRVILLALAFAALTGPCAAVLQAQGRERLVAVVLGSATGVGALVSVLAAGRLGATGGALGVLVLQCVTAAGLVPALLQVRRRNQSEPPVALAGSSGIELARARAGEDGDPSNS